MPSILIHDAGPQTTVQDLGRRGSLRVGIPPSGPMDREAFLLANRLVGNADDEYCARLRTHAGIPARPVGADRRAV
jgi:allophanate hydrolase subunit 2